MSYLEVDQEDARPANRHLHRREGLRMPLHQEVIFCCVLNRSQAIKTRDVAYDIPDALFPVRV